MYPQYKHITLAIIVLFISCPKYTSAIQIYSSKTTNGSVTSLNGLVLVPKTQNNLTQGVTLCGRFYYIRIIESLSVPFFVHSKSYQYFLAKMGYQETFWGFADFNWILKESERSFRIWAANRWHHICIALDKSIKHFVVVKDGYVTSINVTIQDWDLSGIDSQFLSQLHVGESESYKKLSSINAWDYALSIEDMKDWTGCR